jgi:hypothetical protein
VSRGHSSLAPGYDSDPQIRMNDPQIRMNTIHRFL